MADDWRINEKYRKPRKSKGTPFYNQRNYLALIGVGFAAICWGFLEYLPGYKNLKHALLKTDKFDLPEGYLIKKKHFQEGLKSLPMQSLLHKAREREFEKHVDKAEPQTWWAKAFSSSPDSSQT